MYLRDSNLDRKLLKTYNVTDNNYSLYTAINYSTVLCFFSHVVFLIAFLVFNIIPLAVFNIFSCLTFAIVFLINRRGMHNLSLALGISEVLIHAILTVIFVGWETGFHYYVLCVVPLVFFSQIISKSMKSILNIFFSFLYILMYSFSKQNPPVYNLSHTLIIGFNNANIIITFCAFSFVAYYYSWAVEKVEFKLKDTNKKLETLAETDFLTGLFNRRKMVDEINKCIEEFKNKGTSFAVIIADIDNFKIFNDQHGHNCGDLILTTSAAIMKSQVVDIGSIARWGGEEFLILFPNSTLEQGKELAEKLRKSVQDTSVIFNEKRVSITMTFGIYAYNSATTVEEIVNCADKALYTGKRRGKNCVVA